MASVLITGTSSGIGLATALALGRKGHHVYATMRNPSRAPELGERAAQEKLPIEISVMDVNSDSSVKTAIANIQEDAGLKAKVG
jgi:NAD(P)-dependent dehydrogenase (short-subunit alcohol dehydrogenase family)